MKKTLTLSIVCILMFSGIGLAQETGERDGSSVEKAIIIEYGGYHGASIAKEYEYLSQRFGRRGLEWEMAGQYLTSEGGRHYDVLTVELLPSGERKEIYFDITESYKDLMEQFQ